MADHHYLRHVFTELPKAKNLAQIETLLPGDIDVAKLRTIADQG